MRRRTATSLLTVGPLPWLVMLAGSGFVTSLALPDTASIAALCGAPARFDPRELPLLLGPQWSLHSVALGWLVMLVAMMPPLLAQPLLHVWRSSLVARRTWAVLIFGSGYAMIWLTAGIALIPAAIVIKLSAGPAALIAVLGLALVWSCSPLAQAARNSCHRMRRIAVFGRNADRDCLRFGISIGISCLLACWPWMLLAAMLEEWHLVAMALLALFLFAERIAPPAPEAWRLPPALTIARWLAAPQKVLGRS